MKAIVTGSNGLLGSALKKEMGPGHFYHERKDANLIDIHEVRRLFTLNEADTLIHCAARVGGVNANMNNNYSFFLDNFIMNNNIIECALRYETENVVNLLSTCVFPSKAIYPLTADQIDNGKPHETNYGYSYAKRLLYYQTKYAREVTGKNWISIIPTNLYGPHDNFNLETSHLVPALIRKGYEAYLNKSDFVIWGDGTPLRQFLFSEDLARVILWAIKNWNLDIPMMAINTEEYSINQVAEAIADIFNISSSRIKYDKTKPNGQFRKPAVSDVPKDFEFTNLRQGLEKSIEWFINNYKSARK